MRERYVADPATGKLVPADEYYARKANTKRSGLPTPLIQTDTMPPVQSMLDGRFYDSKSALRATYKQAGVTEVGNDSSITKPKPKPKPDRRAIRASVDRAFSRAGFGA